MRIIAFFVNVQIQILKNIKEMNKLIAHKVVIFIMRNTLHTLGISIKKTHKAFFNYGVIYIYRNCDTPLRLR